jgi:hypothetical protein
MKCSITITEPETGTFYLKVMSHGWVAWSSDDFERPSALTFPKNWAVMPVEKDPFSALRP